MENKRQPTTEGSNSKQKISTLSPTRPTTPGLKQDVKLEQQESNTYSTNKKETIYFSQEYHA